jgi:hypothetical protein
MNVDWLKRYGEICRERAEREATALKELNAAVDLAIPEHTWKEFVELESKWVN